MLVLNENYKTKRAGNGLSNLPNGELYCKTCTKIDRVEAIELSCTGILG